VRGVGFKEIEDYIAESYRRTAGRIAAGELKDERATGVELCREDKAENSPESRPGPRQLAASAASPTHGQSHCALPGSNPPPL
jgi:hypothetical protein